MRVEVIQEMRKELKELRKQIRFMALELSTIKAELFEQETQETYN